MNKVLLYGIFSGLLLGGFSIYFSDDSDALKSNSILLHSIGEKTRFVTTNQKPEIIGDNAARRESEQIKSFPNPNNSNSTYEDNAVNILDALFDQKISDQMLRQLIKASINADRGQSIDILLDALVSLSAQYGYNKRSQIIIDVLTEVNSIEVAKKISDYLVNISNTSPELENAMVGVVNAVTNRDEMADYIAEQFMLSADNNVREKLLAIDYPESLERIADFSLMQGDNAFYTKVIDRLDSNPYEHTFNVLLSMNNNQNMTYLASQTPIIEVAQQWAYHQLSGSRFDFVESQLAQGKVSENDKPLVLEMLKHSEDQVRGQAIIAKYWNTRMM